MAKIEFPGFDEYRKKIAALADPAVAEKAIKYAIYPAADAALTEIRSAVPVDSGDLADSLIILPMQNDNGFTYAEITFTGYDSKGVPNKLKARTLESGRSEAKIGKHPFMRKAVNRARKKAVALMQTALDRYLYEFVRK